MKKVLFTLLLLSSAWLAVFAQGSGQNPSTGRKPNIILILADDLGYGDLGCYGGKDIYTPNLDKLAGAGMRWNQFYAASAVCTPTRASILTGRYPLRYGISTVFSDREEHLPEGEILLPRILASAGYATNHVGKWHLGGLNVKHTTDRNQYPYGPGQMGFDYSLVMYEDPAIRGVMYKGKRIYKDGAKYYMRNDTLAQASDKHMTEFETDEVIQNIELLSSGGKPFFLNFCPFNPHSPYEPTPQKYMDMYKGKTSGDELLYRAMVTQLDACVGRIIDKINELGIAENTLIVFTSDNGPANYGSAGSFTGRKGDLYEGGIRVPTLMAWKEKIKAGSVSSELGHSTDLLPTICEAAGATLPKGIKFDGKSLQPHLFTGKPMPDRGTVFWQMNVLKMNFSLWKKTEPFATEVARNGNWKMLALKGKPVALFNIKTDPAEQKNLIASESALVSKLSKELKIWLDNCRNDSDTK